jgi:hypothetical protein
MPTTQVATRAASHAAVVKDALRQGRSHATIPQSDLYVVHLAKDILSRDSVTSRKSVEQVIALVIDLAQRATLEDAEAIGYTLVAIARDEFAKAHPNVCHLVSVGAAQMIEEQCEGRVDEAEALMAYEPTVSNYLNYLAASAAHLRARTQLDDAVRGEVVKKSGVCGAAAAVRAKG